MFSLYTYYCLAFDSYKAWLHRRYYRSLLMNVVIAAYAYFFLYRRDEFVDMEWQSAALLPAVSLRHTHAQLPWTPNRAMDQACREV